MRLLSICFFVCISSIALANPIAVTHPIYIASERLMVTMGTDAAQIEGRFHFHSAAKPNDFGINSDVKLSIPIWIPSDAKHGDSSTGALYESFSKSHDTLDDAARSAWNAAINLKFMVGRQAVPISSLAVYRPTSKHAKTWIPTVWQREGFCCILVTVYFPPILLKGDPEVSINYRQSLSRTRNNSEFYYVANFDNLPEGINTSRIDRYSMTVKNASESPVSLGTVIIPSGYTAILPLKHHEPIVMNIRKH